jgi:hypothetical protein
MSWIRSEVAAEGLLVVNGVKNVAAFGFTYGFIPWTASVGYETVSAETVHVLSSRVYLHGNRSSATWQVFGSLPCSWLLRSAYGAPESEGTLRKR